MSTEVLHRSVYAALVFASPVVDFGPSLCCIMLNWFYIALHINLSILIQCIAVALCGETPLYLDQKIEGTSV